MPNTLCCYICNEDDSISPLIKSPCNLCNLYVHVQCFDTYQKHLFNSFKCVLIQTDEEDHPFAVYTSCSICKKRFEYHSPPLLQKLTHQLQHHQTTADDHLDTEPLDFDEEDDIHQDVQMVVRCIMSMINHIPSHIRQESVECVHKLLVAITHLPLENLIQSIQRIIDFTRFSLFTIATGGIVLGLSAFQYALRLFYDS